MHEAFIIFPHQLFEQNPCIEKKLDTYLVEEYLFFKQLKFHKQKIVLHRSSMKFYYDYLSKNNLNVHYIESTDDLSDVRKLIFYMSQKGIKKIHFIDVVDNWLEKRIKQSAYKCSIEICEYTSPAFLNSKIELKEYFGGKEKYSQTDFYIKQRKKFGILLTDDGSPVGGKWSFDVENRLKYPVAKIPPRVNFPLLNKYHKEALNYVNLNFAGNYGELGNFVYPCTFDESKKWFDEFLEKRFFEFGDYEDAIVSSGHILHHSVLSPLLNIGLLTPKYVIQETLKYSYKFSIPINSIEGFIRQIVGWREFIRGVYEMYGSYQRTRNFWGFKRKIPENFWNAKTNIKPVDTTIKKVLSTGYCHHIERLMVIGNFMLLCEFDPDDVYKWFMELFIDAYDWVVVPNVYGMSQFADGGLMSTKPYISGSNYIIKMSDYKKEEWAYLWDGLFWRFIDKYREFFLSNPRLGMLIKTFDRFDLSKKRSLILAAEDYLANL